MRRFLLILGIAAAVACVLSLAYAALNYSVYKNLFDGSAELYAKLRRRAEVFCVSGSVLAVVSAVCFVIRSRMMK